MWEQCFRLNILRSIVDRSIVGRTNAGRTNAYKTNIGRTDVPRTKAVWTNVADRLKVAWRNVVRTIIVWTNLLEKNVRTNVIGANALRMNFLRKLMFSRTIVVRTNVTAPFKLT